jgi:hypothetical protein
MLHHGRQRHREGLCQLADGQGLACAQLRDERAPGGVGERGKGMVQSCRRIVNHMVKYSCMHDRVKRNCRRGSVRTSLRCEISTRHLTAWGQHALGPSGAHPGQLAWCRHANFAFGALAYSSVRLDRVLDRRRCCFSTPACSTMFRGCKRACSARSVHDQNALAQIEPNRFGEQPRHLEDRQHEQEPGFRV